MKKDKTGPETKIYKLYIKIFQKWKLEQRIYQQLMETSTKNWKILFMILIKIQKELHFWCQRQFVWKENQRKTK